MNDEREKLRDYIYDDYHRLEDFTDIEICNENDLEKAEDITVIDISGVSSIADYFIIANGSNSNQLAAMQDAVDETFYKAGLQARQVEGNQNSTWILIDYNDVIVHLFDKEDRLFYDLERIWKDGKIVEIEE